MRILVIDDDRSVGAAIQALLNSQGCEVEFVDNSLLGIQAFESSSFDAVMVDIFMPGVDGLETIKAFRRRSSTVPIIAMSGFRFCSSLWPAPNFLGMAAALGATDCLRKPFAPQQLMASINACLDHARPNNRAAVS